MTTQPPTLPQDLRQRAEALYRASENLIQESTTPEETKQLLHELRVHQIQLETQNEELRSIQAELDVSQSRYFDLYDLAPVGYMTFGEPGLILEANLAAANMFGVARSALIKQPIKRFLCKEDQDLFYLHRQQAFTSSAPQVSKMLLKRSDGSCFWAQVQATPAAGGEFWITINDISSQKQAEEKLKRSEEDLRRQNGLFSSLLKNLHVGVFMVEVPSGKPLVANDAALDILGRGIFPEATRHNLSEIYKASKTGSSAPYPADEMPIVLGMNGVSSHIDDMEVERPDGTKTILEVFGSPVTDDQGHIWASLVSFSDITARKEAEATLRESERILNKSQEIAHLGSWELDVPTGRLTWSDEVYRIFGIPPRQFAATYEAFLDAVHPEDRDSVNSAYRSSVQEDNDFYEIEHRVISKLTGNVLFVYEKCEHVRDAAGKITRSVGMVHDITERKQAENALRESREKYKANIDNSFDVIFSLNAEGTFQFVSRAWERHFGYSIKEVLGKNFDDFIHPDDITPCTKYLSKVISAGKSKTSPQFRVKHSDGSWHSFIANGSRYANTDNEWQFIGVAHDITDHLAAEQNLLQAKVAAETATTAKSQFLSTMSHEIRTPMNVVLSIVQLLQKTDLTPEQREFTEIALRSGVQLVDLLNDILDLAKMEAGKIELEIYVFDLPSMIADTIQALSLQAREKGVRLVSSIDAEVPTASKCDAGRLRQILINLVGNAIKFTPKGTVSLHIQKDSEDDHSLTLRFLIQDSGIGIAAEKLENIFAPFTQANGSTTRTYGGTGLGLSICKYLVEQMGGAIGVESVEGEGSTFWFTMLLEKQVEVPPLAHAVPTLAPLTVLERGVATGVRILLVDDCLTNQLGISRLMKLYGYQVDEASNGKEAVDALEKNDYALVLMDCMMPEMNGYEVTAVIRDPASSVRRHDIPVIALTGYAMKQDRDYCLAAGMDDHLPKPVLFPDLLAMLEKYLKGETK
ncbi:MAG: PAS domain S-box protein [Desulfuromonadaceae bacterium]